MADSMHPLDMRANKRLNSQQYDNFDDQLGAYNEKKSHRGAIPYATNAINSAGRGALQMLETPWNIINNAPKLLNLLPGEQGMKKNTEYAAEVGGPVGNFIASIGEDPLIDATRHLPYGDEVGSIANPNPNYPGTSQFFEDVGVGVAPLGAGPLLSMGKASAGPIMQKVGQYGDDMWNMVKANPLKAIGAEVAASGGAATGRYTADEMEMGPVASFFAEMMGSLSPAIAATSLPRIATHVLGREGATESLEAMTRQGVRPSVGLVGDRTAGQLESGASALPLFSSVPENVRTQQFDQFSDALTGAADNVRPNGPMVGEMGEQIYDIAEGGAQRMKAGFSGREDDLMKAIGADTPVNTAGTRKALEQMLQTADAKTADALQNEIAMLDRISAPPGDALQLHHGTSRQFDNFATEPNIAVNRYGRKMNKPFYYFTDDPNVAQTFARGTGGRQEMSFAKYTGFEPDEVGSSVNHIMGDPDLASEFTDYISDIEKRMNKGWQFEMIDEVTGEPIKITNPSEIAEQSLNPDNYVEAIKPGREGRVLSKNVYGRQIDLTSQQGFDQISDDVKEVLKSEFGITKPLPPNSFDHEQSAGELITRLNELGVGKIAVPDVYESGFKSYIVNPNMIEGNVNKSAPYSKFRNFRSNFGAEIQDTGILSGAQKQMYAGATQDLQEAATKAGVGDDFKALMSEQAAAHADDVRLSEGGDFKQAKSLKGGQIERSKAFLKQAYKNPDKMAYIQRNATPEQWSQLRADIAHDLGLARAAGQGAAGDVISPTKFSTEWAAMDPRVKNMLFDDDLGTRQTLDDLALIAEDFQRRGLEANSSRTAGTGMGAMQIKEASKGAAMLGMGAAGASDLGLTATASGITYAALKGLMSETLARWAAGQTPTFKGSVAPRIPGAIGRASTDEEK